MATYQKFNQFTDDLIAGVHDFDSDTFKVMLTNTAPTASNAVKADLTEITAGDGYTAGGSATTITTSTSSGTAKVSATDVTFTATGAVGPFRYAVLYNDTPTAPADPLVGFWDYGSSITLQDQDTFTVDFSANGAFTVA